MEILCFGSADFGDRSWVNAQQLMWRLAARHRVLYVNSLGLRPPRANRRDLRRILARVRGLRRGPDRPYDDRSLFVFSPLTLPPSRSRTSRSIARGLLGRQLKGALRRLGLQRPLVWTFLPSSAEVVAELPARAVVYHCVDAYEANPDVDPDLVLSLERRLLARADRVIASSAPLRERLARQHPRVALWPNVVDTDLYPPPRARPPQPPALASVPRPRIGYLGNLAGYKCDLPLLHQAMRARPDLAWVLIGGIGHGEAGRPAAALTELTGVHWLGERPRAELPALLHHLDVGLIPFARNETTRHSFPLKFFEYLACGLPVVCPPLASLTEHLRAPYAFRYDGASEFLPAVERALAASSPAEVQARRTLAESHSWKARIADAEALLEELARGGGA